MSSKPTNPKDTVSVRKVPFSSLPLPPILEVAVAMFEGSRKYGRSNYREAGVCAGVYYDAAFRHLSAWWEGEDTDPDSGISHVSKAIATLLVLRDSMMRGNWVDDRPPRSETGLVAEMNRLAAAVVDRYPDAKAPFTEKPLPDTTATVATQEKDLQPVAGDAIMEVELPTIDPERYM